MKEKFLNKLIGKKFNYSDPLEYQDKDSCKLYDKTKYEYFLNGELSVNEMEHILRHSCNCKYCLNMLLAKHGMLQIDAENKYFFEKINDFLGDLDNDVDDNFNIIMNIADLNKLCVVFTTGIIDDQGDVNANKCIECDKIKLRKEFREFSIIVNVDISYDQAKKQIMSDIVLFDLDTKKLLSGYDVILCYDQMLISRLTKNNDKVSLYLDHTVVNYITIISSKFSDIHLQIIFINK